MLSDDLYKIYEDLLTSLKQAQAFAGREYPDAQRKHIIKSLKHLFLARQAYDLTTPDQQQPGPKEIYKASKHAHRDYEKAVTKVRVRTL